MHIDLEVEQAKVAAGVVPHEDAAIDFKGVRHDEGRVPVLVGDQRMEGDVFGCFFGAEDRAARKGRAGLQRKSGCGPDRDEVRFQGNVCLLFVPAAALAGDSQAENSNQGSADQGLPNQFPQFYGTQV